MDEVNRTSKSPLTRAILDARTNEVQKLLESGADVDELSYFRGYGEPPLVTAVRYKRERLVSILLQHSANVNIASDRKHTALIRAAQKNLTDIVKQLLQYSADANALDGTNLCALYWAVNHQNIESVHELIKYGAEVNLQVHPRTTILHTAAQTGNVEIMKVLLSSGATVDAKDDFGDTPLFVAVRINSFDVVELLLKSGADINTQNIDYRTPLHMSAASVHNSVDLTQLLLDNGSHVNVRDRFGSIPLVLSLRNYIVRPNYTIAKALVQHGSCLNDPNSVTAMEWTLITHGNFDLLYVAIDAGFKIQGVDWIDEFINGTPGRRRWYTKADYDNDQEKEFIAFIRHKLKNVDSLYYLNRIALRQHLIKVCGGESIYYKIQRLPLPDVVKLYLLMED